MNEEVRKFYTFRMFSKEKLMQKLNKTICNALATISNVKAGE
jgi:hypothetical protein